MQPLYFISENKKPTEVEYLTKITNLIIMRLHLQSLKDLSISTKACDSQLFFNLCLV